MAYEDLFRKIGAEYELDWHILAQQCWRESRFNPLAVGAAGDMGLMQILPATWDEWAPKVGVFDPFDPESNIRVAAAILAYLRDTLVKQGRPERYWWLVAYNWGIGNTLRLLRNNGTWEQIPAERRAYATEIILAAEADALAEQLMWSDKPIYG